MGFRKIRRKVFSVIQKPLLSLLLFLLYIAGFGLTYIFAFIFKRHLLKGTSKREKSFWKDAKGYQADIGECLEQS